MNPVILILICDFFLNSYLFLNSDSVPPDNGMGQVEVSQPVLSENDAGVPRLISPDIGEEPLNNTDDQNELKNEIDCLKNRLEEKKQQIQDLENKLNSEIKLKEVLNKRIEDLKEDVKKLNSILDAKRCELDAAQKALSEKMQEILAKLASNTVDTNDLAIKSATIASLEKERTRLISELAERKRELASSSEEMEKLNKSLKIAEDNLIAAKTELEIFKEKFKFAEQNIGSVSTTASDSIQFMEKAYDELVKMNERLASANDQLKTEIESRIPVAALDAANERIKELEKKNRKMEDERKELEKAHAEERQRFVSALNSSTAVEEKQKKILGSRIYDFSNFTRTISINFRLDTDDSLFSSSVDAVVCRYNGKNGYVFWAPGLFKDFPQKSDSRIATCSVVLGRNIEKNPWSKEVDNIKFLKTGNRQFIGFIEAFPEDSLSDDGVYEISEHAGGFEEARAQGLDTLKAFRTKHDLTAIYKVVVGKENNYAKISTMNPSVINLPWFDPKEFDTAMSPVPGDLLFSPISGNLIGIVVNSDSAYLFDSEPKFADYEFKTAESGVKQADAIREALK